MFIVSHLLLYHNIISALVEFLSGIFLLEMCEVLGLKKEN